MLGPLQINLRINAESHEALKSYRDRFEKEIRKTFPGYKMTLPEAFRMLALTALEREKAKNTAGVEET